MTTDDLCECPMCGRMHRRLGTPPWMTAWKHLKPGDLVEIGEGATLHRWRVLGVHLGALGQESLVELESETHKPGVSSANVRPDHSIAGRVAQALLIDCETVLVLWSDG